MIHKIRIFFVIALFPISIQAQQYTIADTIIAKRHLKQAKEMILSGQNERILPHLDTAKTIFKEILGERTLEYCAILVEEASTYYRLGDVQRAEVTFDTIIPFIQKIFGENHMLCAKAYSNYGIIFIVKQNYAKAEEYTLKSYQIRLDSLGEDAQGYFESCNNLKILYERKGDFQQSLVYAKKVMAWFINNYGEQHKNMAYAYSGIANVYHHLADYPNALVYYHKELEIYKREPQKHLRDLAGVYNNLVDVYEKSGDLDNSIAVGQSALNILRHLDNNLNLVGTTLMNIGNVLADKGDFLTARDTLNKALDTLLAAAEQNKDMIGRVYFAIGKIDFENSDFGKAIEYFEKALVLFMEALGPDHPDVATINENIGSCFSQLGRLDEAVVNQEQVIIAAKEAYGEDGIRYINTLAQMGHLLGRKGDYKEAAKYHLKAISAKQKQLGEEHPEMAKDFHNVGLAYRYLERYDSAIWFFNKSLDLDRKKFSDTPSVLASTLSDLAYALGKKGQYTEGENTFRQCFESLNFNDSTDFQKVKSFSALMQAFRLNGDFYREWYYDKSGDIKHLKQAKEAYQLALAAIRFYRREVDNPSSKLAISQEHFGVFEGNIEVCYLLNKQEPGQDREAFKCAEEAKSMVLYESIKRNEALHFGVVPDSLVREEYNLKVNITYQEKRRKQLMDQGLEHTDSTVLALTGILFDLHRRYEILNSKLETDYPEYYLLKNDLGIIDSKHLQQELIDSNQTLIEYFLGDRSLFIFAATRKDFRLVRLEKDSLEQMIRDYLQICKSQRVMPSKSRFLAWQLYQKLLLPVSDLLKDELIIIPDGVLNTLPFETLTDVLAPSNNPARFSFLLLKHTINYCYSATLREEMQNKQHRQDPEIAWLGFAPFAGTVSESVADDRGYNFCHISVGEEVAEIPAILKKGYSVIGEESTKEFFEKKSGSAAIVHISTHGVAETIPGNIPYLLFPAKPEQTACEQLFIGELYNIPLNADLIVLATCVSGTGNLAKGEGIISLARACAYSGAKGMITSLFNVGDKSTADLMKYFYRNLYTGMSKGKALQEAKIQVMRENLGHPFYWSGFIGVGDM